jgi:hypothetical protein
MDREIALLESDVNCLKREKEVMEQQYNWRKQLLLDQSMNAITGERHTQLIREMVELNSRFRQESWRLNAKITFALQALNRKKQEQQQQLH